MAERRPCRICRRWFDVDPHAGRRHRVCGSEACQRERNRRSCRRWREEHPEEVATYRLLEVLPADPETAVGVVEIDPIRVFDAAAVRHAVPVGTRVVIGQLAKVVLSMARHGVVPKALGVRRRKRKVRPTPARHESAQPRPPP